MAKKIRPPKTAWPEGAEEDLRQMHRANAKAMVILVTLRAKWPHHPFTRNAVLGKIWRLGLTNVNSNKQTPRSSSHARAKATPITWTPAMDEAISRDYGLGRQPSRIAELLFQEHGVVTTRHAVRTRLMALGRYKEGRNNAPPTGRPLQGTSSPPKYLVIVEDVPATSVAFETTSYERGQCQYPTSDDMKMVCGGKAVTGSYCARHAAIVYRSPPTGKRIATFRKVNQYYE